VAGIIVLAVVCFALSIVYHLYFRQLWVFWMSFFVGSTQAEALDEEWKDTRMMGEWSAPILFTGFLFMQSYFRWIDSSLGEKIAIFMSCCIYILSVVGAFLYINRSRARKKWKEDGEFEKSNPQ
jgi:amino acid permease